MVMRIDDGDDDDDDDDDDDGVLFYYSCTQHQNCTPDPGRTAVGSTETYM